MRLAHATAVAASTALTLLGSPALAQDVPSSPPPCPHVGTHWIDQRVGGTGGVQCPTKKFKLTVSVTGAGGQVIVEFRGCPTHLVIHPGHNAQTPKAHHHVGHPQKLRSWRQSFTADCGGLFSSPSCAPSADVEMMDHVVIDWTEFACSY